MSQTARGYLLGPLLKGVSRSFYLTLRVLPAGMRDPIALAYLLARAADTIADTTLIAPSKRLELLLALRERVNAPGGDEEAARRIAAEAAAHQTVTDEKVLLESVGPALALIDGLDATDRAAVREIVTTLTTGMEFDLRTFPDERSGEIAALGELAELDRYTYLVAGCVGEFWSKMTLAHLPGSFKDTPARMIERGVRFGKALQMTNVLRDCARDLRIGRCYLPASMLARHGLTPAGLLPADASMRARPLMLELVEHTLALYDDALAYTLAISRGAIRLRLACIWPIAIGLETLQLLVDNDRWLDPQAISKIGRNQVYRIMARSMIAVASDTALRGWIGGLARRVRMRMAAPASVNCAAVE